jgi:O-antigen/teichoic acid export membrane protein
MSRRISAAPTDKEYFTREPPSGHAEVSDLKLPWAGVGSTTIFQVAVLLCGMGSGIVLARSLGPAGRGELAIDLLWPGILALLGDLGLGFSFSYHAGKLRNEIHGLWTLAALTGLLAGTGISVIGWFVIPHFVPAIKGHAENFGLALLSVPMVLMSGYQAFLLLGTGFVADFNFVRLIVPGVNLILALSFAAIGWTSVRWFLTAYLLAQASGLILSGILIGRRYRPRFTFPRDLLRSVFFYGLKTHAGSIAAQANIRADQAYMSVVMTTSQLGLYVVAVSVGGILSPFLNAMAIVIMPRASHAVNDAQGAQLVARHVKLACLISAPVLLGSVVLMPWLLPAFFGVAYRPAVHSAQVLSFAALFQGVNAVLGNSLRSLGRPGPPAIAEAFGMVATIALLFLLLPVLGIMGAAIASLAAYALVGLLQFILLAKMAKVNILQLALTPIDFPIANRSRKALQQWVTR